MPWTDPPENYVAMLAPYLQLGQGALAASEWGPGGRLVEKRRLFFRGRQAQIARAIRPNGSGQPIGMPRKSDRKCLIHSGR